MSLSAGSAGASRSDGAYRGVEFTPLCNAINQRHNNERLLTLVCGL